MRELCREELDRFCFEGYLARTFAEYIYRRALNAPGMTKRGADPNRRADASDNKEMKSRVKQ